MSKHKFHRHLIILTLQFLPISIVAQTDFNSLMNSLISSEVEEVASEANIIQQDQPHYAPDEIPSKEDLLARHKKMVSSLGSPTSTTTVGNVYSENPVNVLHYPNNLRLYRTAVGECLLPEPLAESKLRGGMVPDTHATVSEGQPYSMFYTIKTPQFEILVIQQNGSAYLYYSNGVSLKISKTKSNGDIMFRSLHNFEPKKEKYVWSLYNLNFFKDPSSDIFLKKDDLSLKLYTVDRSHRFGWTDSDIIASDGSNIYILNPQTGLLSKEGKMNGINFVREPEGLNLKSFSGTKATYDNDSYIVFHLNGANNYYPGEFRIRRNNTLLERPAGSDNSTLYYEEGGGELKAVGYFNYFKWDIGDKPYRCFDYATVTNSQGQYLTTIENGRNREENNQIKQAAQKRSQQAYNSALAVMKRKYGKWVEKAVKGEIVVGMPFNLIKEIFILNTKYQGRYSSDYIIGKAPETVTPQGIYFNKYQYGIKLAYISVSNGKVTYVSYY